MAYVLVWSTHLDDSAALEEIAREEWQESFFRDYPILRSLDWRHDGDCFSSSVTSYKWDMGTFAIFHESIYEG